MSAGIKVKLIALSTELCKSVNDELLDMCEIKYALSRIPV